MPSWYCQQKMACIEKGAHWPGSEKATSMSQQHQEIITGVVVIMMDRDATIVREKVYGGKRAH